LVYKSEGTPLPLRGVCVVGGWFTLPNQGPQVQPASTTHLLHQPFYSVLFKSAINRITQHQPTVTLYWKIPGKPLLCVAVSYMLHSCYPKGLDILSTFRGQLRSQRHTTGSTPPKTEGARQAGVPRIHDPHSNWWR